MTIFVYTIYFSIKFLGALKKLGKLMETVLRVPDIYPAFFCILKDRISFSKSDFLRKRVLKGHFF